MKIKAKVVFLKNDGRQGRNNPPLEGYHPQIKLGVIQTSCKIFSQKKDKIVFGFDFEHEVYLDVLLEKEHTEALLKTKEFELFEGSRLIGRGRIQENNHGHGDATLDNLTDGRGDGGNDHDKKD